jgi:hypothetical protein
MSWFQGSEYANSVLVCEHRGGTQLERIDPEKLTHWLSKYRLGEIWRIGEFGSNPSKVLPSTLKEEATQLSRRPRRVQDFE